MLGAVVTDGTPRAEAARAHRGRAADGRPGPGRRGLAAAVAGCRGGDARCRVTVIDYGAKDSIARLLAEAGRRRDGAAARRDRRRTCAPASPTASCSPTGPATPARWTSTSPSVRAMLDAGPPALRHLPRPPAARPARSAWRPSSSASATAARTTRCWSSETRPRARDEPEPRLRGRHAGRRRRRASRSRTRRSTTARSRACGVPDRPVWSMQFHPEAAPGPHDARDALVAFVEPRRRGARRAALMPRRDDLQQDRRHRLRPDRDRPGLRVRLLRRAGPAGAARGGLRDRPRQLQPGDDHDRPGLGRPRPTSSRSTWRASPACCAASGPTRCCRRWAARPRSTWPWSCEARGRAGRARHRADRRLRRGHRDGRGPRGCSPRAMASVGLRCARSRDRPHGRRGAAPSLAGDAAAAARDPPGVHARRAGRRLRRHDRGARRRRRARRRGVADRPGAGRGVGLRLGRVRARGDPRPRRQRRSSSARSRTSTRWASTPATRSASRPR